MQKKYLTIFLIGCAIGGSFASVGAVAQQVSVAISNDVVVLTDRDRSGVFELVNFAPVPVEYRVATQELPEELKATAEFMRWAPRRAVAPGNRTIPVRVAARPNADLEPGEYMIPMVVRASRGELPEIEEERDNAQNAAPNDPLIGMSVGIQPVLPVRIYYRHQIDPPRLTEARFEKNTDASQGHIGHFAVEKEEVSRSFVGHLEIIHAPTGEVLRKGRMHVPPNREPRNLNVTIPEGDNAFSAEDRYCLRLWDHHPPQGEPYTEHCS